MITVDATLEASKTGCRQRAGQPSAADSGRKFENDPMLSGARAGSGRSHRINGHQAAAGPFVPHQNPHFSGLHGVSAGFLEGAECEASLDDDLGFLDQLCKLLGLALDLRGHVVRAVADGLSTDFAHALAELW